MFEMLKELVYAANLELEHNKLVICNWGNVSGIDRTAGVVAIKPSGVPYIELTPDKIVVVDLSGKTVEGALKPSSDTPMHLELYRILKRLAGSVIPIPAMRRCGHMAAGNCCVLERHMPNIFMVLSR